MQPERRCKRQREASEPQNGDQPSGALAGAAGFDVGALAGHDGLAVAAAEACGTTDGSGAVVHERTPPGRAPARWVFNGCEVTLVTGCTCGRSPDRSPVGESPRRTGRSTSREVAGTARPLNKAPERRRPWPTFRTMSKPAQISARPVVDRGEREAASCSLSRWKTHSSADLTVGVSRRCKRPPTVIGWGS